jgi:uncharacterized protein
MVASRRTLTVLRPATVAVFARSPKLGEVKTRLARDVGEEEALAAHEDLLANAVRRLARDQSYTLELWIAGAIDHPLVMHLAVVHGVELRLQQGIDLGARMFAAMATIRRDGAWPIVAGSDVPILAPSDVHGAVSALNAGADVVLAPTEDGGYGLIAMREPDARMFDGVEWGSARVLDQTLARAKGAGLRVHLLREVWDVDDLADYRRWRALEPGMERPGSEPTG